MVRGIIGSLGAILATAQEAGLVNRNVVRELRRQRKAHHEARLKGKPQVGIDIPKPEEVRALLAAAKGKWRPFLLTAVFTGFGPRSYADYDGRTWT